MNPDLNNYTSVLLSIRNYLAMAQNLEQVKLKYKPVGAKNWPDLVALFERKGGPSYCWCMVWRNMDKGLSRNSMSDKKHSLHKLVSGNTPVGLLCYDGSVQVAWCSVAPRENYRELSGTDGLEGVWSLVCFFIQREYRKLGLKKKLVEQAMTYAKKKGAKYLEAYPVDQDAPSYRFMGFKRDFEAMDFEFKQKAGSRRYVMLKKL